MNRSKICFYPVIVYCILLVLLWLLSWLLGVVQLLDGNRLINSLMTAEGVRWAVRNSLLVTDGAPWGSAFLLLTSFGLLVSSGFLRFLCDMFFMRRLSPNRSKAGVMALVVMFVYIFILLLCMMTPWRLLMGVTSDVLSSPLVKGGQLLFLIGSFFVSGIYGYVYGNFRSIIDVVQGVCSFIESYVPALLAMLPANGLLSCMQYMGLFALWNIDETMLEVVLFVLCLLPFLFQTILNVYIKHTSE